MALDVLATPAVANATTSQMSVQLANSVSRFHLGSETDLSDLSSEQTLRLTMCVTEYRSAGKRLVGELFAMTSQLAEMQEILGSRFRAFVSSELGLNQRTVSRYLHMNKVLKCHFVQGETFKLEEANAFTQRALALLSPETEDGVMDELKELAQGGNKIDQNVVLEILAKHEGEGAAKLAGAQAELTSVTRELHSVRQQREVDQARAQRELTNQAEMLRRADERSRLLQEEIETLQKQSTQVQYEDRQVEVVPEGFTTIQEAITQRQGELKRLTQERGAIATEINDLEQRKSELEQALNQIQLGSEEFLGMKQSVDALINKFPLALLKGMSDSDKAVKAAIATLGQTMVLFGQQLTNASA